MGYEVRYRTTSRQRVTLTARGVVFAAGAIGTNELLRSCKDSGALPRISDRLGRVFRTNSEALQGATSSDRHVDYSHRPQITGGIFPDESTMIQSVTLGPVGGLTRFLLAQMTPQGPARRRARMLGGLIVQHPRFPLTALRPTAR